MEGSRGHKRYALEGEERLERNPSNVLEIAAGDTEIPHPVVVLASFYYNRSAILSWLEAAAVQFVPA